MPPLALTTTGQVRTPSSPLAAVGNTLLNLPNGRAEPGEITDRFQPVNSTASGTAETTKRDRFGTAGKIGEDKAMPPHFTLTVRTRAWFSPGK